MADRRDGVAKSLCKCGSWGGIYRMWTDSIFCCQSDLPHRAVSVYIYLVDRANKDGECWYGIPRTAADLKKSQSTVR